MKRKLNLRGMGAASGFTLIELLVVVSIIALLISIMLPALSKARESSRRVACASNLHQIGLGIGIYAVQNNDFLPYFAAEDRPRLQTSYWLNSTIYLWGDPGPAEKNPRLLNKAIGTSVFQCPSDKSNRNQMFPDGVYASVGNSYPYNSGIIHDTKGNESGKLFGPGKYGSPGIDVLWGKKFSQIKSPARIVAVGDITMWYVMHHSAPSHQDVGYDQTFIHDTQRYMSNLLFADNHVEYSLMREPPEHLINEDYAMVLVETDL